MKTWLSIPTIVLVLMGCVFWGEKREKIYTVRQVTEDNVLLFSSVSVKINPDLKYKNISGGIKVEIMGQASSPTKREFHIFTRPGLDNIVFIETHTRNHPHTFDQSQDLTKKMDTIQKGRKPIDGKPWYVYVRSDPQFPEQILNAVKQEGIRMKQYQCGLEIGVARVIDPNSRIYIRYYRGVDDCQGLPENGRLLSDTQIQMIRKLALQFEENITISDQSGE